jgi:hypothetical protein
MSTEVVNHVSGMVKNLGKKLHSFGKDSTGLVTYQFNQQGFRNHRDYEFIPDYAFFGCSLVFGVGVDYEKIFPTLFTNSHNYGLAGHYDNHDIMQILKKFTASDLCGSRTQIAVVWHSRDSDCLPQFYDQLKDLNITHFYCGEPLPLPRCYRFPRQLDQDVSGTHPGLKTHLAFSKMLCAIFDR